MVFKQNHGLACTAQHPVPPDLSAIRARFESVLDTLRRALPDPGMGSWTVPGGGYFRSFDTLPGLGREEVQLADEIGVKLTPAGAGYLALWQ